MGPTDAVHRQRPGRLSAGRPDPIPATWGLCGLCVAAFLLGLTAQSVPPLHRGGGDFVWARAFDLLFALRPEAIAQGALWQALTYALLHGHWAHLLINVAGLAVTGATLERLLGGRRTLALFALGAAAGACGFLGSLLADPRLPSAGACVGASAILTACIGAATTLAWRERVTLWVAIVPLRLRAWWLLPLFLVFSVCEILLWPTVTAYGAHLGGWLAGLALGCLWHRRLIG